MGNCNQPPRLPQRESNLDDLSTVNLNFVGGTDFEKNIGTDCPTDKLILSYTELDDPEQAFGLSETMKAEKVENVVKHYR